MVKQPFEAKINIQQEKVIIDLYGEINAFAEQALNAAYDEAELSNPSTIILNFTEVSYINSTGIALIVGLLSRARKANRRLAVFGLSDHYLEIFRITRLSTFMDIYPDQVSAIA